MALSKKLRPITDNQKKWAFRHCFEHYAYRLPKGKTSCMECGHEWQLTEEVTNVSCPHCGTPLKVEGTRKRTNKQIEYFCKVTAVKGYQVMRFFFMEAYGCKGKPTVYECKEAVQQWLDENGKTVTVALQRGLCYKYNDIWKEGSKLEIRPNKDMYDIYPAAIYPRKKVIPVLKRNGFKGDFHDCDPTSLFRALITDRKAETLIKSGQYKMLRRHIYHPYAVSRKWHAIKICIRNGYMIDNAAMWCDHLDLLDYLGKDTHNPKFICPTDLNAEHDRLIEMRNKQWERQRRERERQREAERREAQRKQMAQKKKHQRIYQRQKSKFFDLVISDGFIVVKVLKSVNEFYEEGKEMHHCVFANEYYLKHDSLVLSATIDGKRIETVEVSLKSFTVEQCSGAYNSNTEYHDRIVNLVDNNMNLIRHRMNKAAI